jgi:hypothetical protein
MAATTPPNDDTDPETDTSDPDHTDVDSSGSSPTDPVIEVIPPTTDETGFDRGVALLIEVDDTMEGHLETAEEVLPCAIRDLYASSKLNIDHVEFFAYNTSDSVVFGLTSYLANITNSTQSTLNDIVDSDGGLKEPLQTLKNNVESSLPEALDIKLGVLPFGMFGSPSMTTRIVVDHDNRKIGHGDKLDGVGLKQFLTEFADEQFLYYTHIRRNTSAPEKFEYQLTVRIALFDPQYRIGSASMYASRFQFGRQIDPIECFAKLGVTSSLSRIDNQYRIHYMNGDPEVTSKPDSPLGHPAAELEILTGDSEYDELKRGGYGASNKLESICEYTSILARETDLKKFMTLGAAPSTGDPTESAPTTAIRGAGELGTDVDSLTPDPVLIPVDEAVDTDDEIASQTPSTANDGTELHWKAIKNTALALKNDGYDVFIVTQDTGSRPDLWAKAPNGEIFAVEVESTTRSKAAGVLTNIARQALWGYKTITVMVPQENKQGQRESLRTIGDWARNTVSKPFRSEDEHLGDSKTRLYNRGEDVKQDGKTLLLPEGVDESEWWVTPDNRCLLLDGRTILAEGHITDPLEDFEFMTPRYYEDGDRYIVEDADGEVLQTCAKESDIAYTCVSPPYRPVDLSYIQYVEQIYCYDPEEKELVEHDMTASWDTPQASTRHEKSHQDAFGTFVVDREGTRLMEADCRPFIRGWIDDLSAHGGPARNIYGEYRQDYTNRSGNNDDVGKIHHYRDASFRFDRGLVSPDIEGLATEPSFIDEWGIDPDDVLGEPLIEGLDDRRHVTDDSDMA